MDTFSTERLVPNSSGDDDSDGDLVTDFLSSDGNDITIIPKSSLSTQTNTLTSNTGITTTATTLQQQNICTNPFLSNYDEQQFNNLSNNTSNSNNTATNKTTNNQCMTSSSGNSAQQQLQNLFQNNQQQQQQQQQPKPNQQIHPNFQNIPLINVPPPSVNTQINMVPIISVTPHSPGTKYSSILEDSLCHLQNIRESVVQMKNSTVPIHHGFVATSLVHSAVLSSSRLFSSCPSLSDLSANNLNFSIFSPQQPFFNSDRRKSWTGIEDLTECSHNTKSSHKSVSLSSLDSEEQESIRVAERHRTSRNSTGGISTHSLNEAELARDFERIAAKRNLAPTLISRIPLQKSISTPSIAPLRIPGAKEETTITTTRHLSDSEDDQQDDRSLLCVRDKNEVYADHPEKRRKRGSLFFRKKKDKTKTKGQSTNCDACGATINLSTVKDHAAECKAKTTKLSKSGSGKNKSSTSHTSHHEDSRDYYDGHNENSNYSDDTPLIRVEFLNEPPIGPHDLGADPSLGIALEEHDSWSPSVPKEIVKSLKDKQQVKRQEHIYEFIMTEKHHCQTLLVMQKIFVESIQRHFSRLNIERLFPRLSELTELHTTFLKKLRQKQRECPIVDSIADIILDFLSAASAQRLKSTYGEFCSNHRSALEKFKYYTSDQTFAEWYKHCLTNPLLKKKGIPECILFVTQRLTKYPLLIDPLLKSSREDRMEQEKLQRSMALVKAILVDVDARVAEKEKQDRQLEIFKNIDVKSSTMFKNKIFKKADVVDTNRRLKFEGFATLMQGRSKMQNVMVVVLSDCLLFLQENSHNKYTFFTPENKAGVISLQKLLIREKAGTESRGIYIISSNPAYPEMYELKVQNPKDKNAWIQAIRAAVLECPTDDLESDDLTAEEKQRLIDEKQATMRELISMGNSELEDKMRQKDIEQALLLEEKILLQLALLKDKKNVHENAVPKAEEFLSNFGSYKDLITDDCDTVEIWKRVLNTVQEISQLAATLYTAATGLPVSRSVSSVGEKQSDTYSSPTLPKRAETFGGFDDRRVNKTNIPWRDAVLSTLPISTLPTSKDNQFLNSNMISSGSGNISTNLHSEYDKNLNTLVAAQQSQTAQQISLKDNNYAALQVSHHLHTLLCIISQQMTTIYNLQAQLANYRDNPKTIYKHNDQLEELRNLQDKLQEEKQAWQKEKEHQEKDLEEQRVAQELLQKQIKAEQEDIKQQREQLYRKMELLSSQGLLLSPNTSIPMPSIVQSNDDNTNHYSSDDLHSTQSSISVADGSSSVPEKKKEKWRSTSMSKTPPANLLSAKNAPKVNEASIKQQIPMKLSSLSSTKTDKAPNSSNNITSPNNSSGVITQMFPLKLADKKNQNMTPNHARTGSSPAIIQQPPQQSGNPATRTNTYPKLPDRYRLRNSDAGLTSATPSTTSILGPTILTSQQQQQNNISHIPGPQLISGQLSQQQQKHQPPPPPPPHSPRNSSLYSQLSSIITSTTIATGTGATITPPTTTIQSRQLQNYPASILISGGSNNCQQSHQQQHQQQQLLLLQQKQSQNLQQQIINNPKTITTLNNNNQQQLQSTTIATTSHQQQQQDNLINKTKPDTPEEEEIYF